MDQEERRLISRQLHEELAQELAGVNLQLAALRASSTISNRSHRLRIDQAQHQIERSVETVRRYAASLHPPLLDELGLVPALRSYIMNLPSRRGLKISLDAPVEIKPLDPLRRTALYRVAQEALTHAAGRLQAGRVLVRAFQTRRMVGIEIRDDGEAQTDQSAAQSGSMQRRVEMLGGKLVVKSGAWGNMVRAEIPSRNAPLGADFPEAGESPDGAGENPILRSGPAA